MRCVVAWQNPAARHPVSRDDTALTLSATCSSSTTCWFCDAVFFVIERVHVNDMLGGATNYQRRLRRCTSRYDTTGLKYEVLVLFDIICTVLEAEHLPV